MPFLMRVVNTAAHFSACLAEEIAPTVPERNYSWLLLRVFRLRKGATERSFVSLGREPEAEPDVPGIRLTASPQGEGGAFPLQTRNALREEHIMRRTSSAAIVGVILAGFGVLSPHQLFAQSLQTAVPVEQEPRHWVVFENNHVRIYDALIPPGDITLFHTHSFDNVATTVSGGRLKNEIPGRPPTEQGPSTGNISFAKGTNAPYTHRIENIGTTPLRFVVAELHAPSASPGTPTALDAVPGHRMVLENDRVKVYRVSIDPKQATGIRSRTLPWLRISISQSMISINEPGKPPKTVQTRPGDYRWHEAGTTDSIENVGSTTYEATEIEWK